MMPSYTVTLTDSDLIVGTGWLPPLPDFRDFDSKNERIAPMTKLLKVSAKTPKVPTSVDLRAWCSPIDNQGALGSCSAHAGMGIVEYFERRAFGTHIDGSRLFLYKATRDLMGVTGDTGAWLRNVMGALALFGIPPEKYWPYNIADFDKSPSAFVYAVADNYESLKYFCHDPQTDNLPPADVLASVKTYLAAGVPAMFGFFGFDSFDKSNIKGGIPFPCPNEQAKWGHAIMAVGYDDSKKITNTLCNQTTTGALLIRNSWGTTWGDAGYGWLPYEYVLNKIAVDFWSLLSMEWLETKEFGL